MRKENLSTRPFSPSNQDANFSTCPAEEFMFVINPEKYVQTVAKKRGRIKLSREFWTEQEDLLALGLPADINDEWQESARQVHGRTEQAVKDRWVEIKNEDISVIPRNKIPEISELMRHENCIKAGLSEIELIAARLYTGPMFVHYDAVLRDPTAELCLDAEFNKLNGKIVTRKKKNGEDSQNWVIFDGCYIINEVSQLVLEMHVFSSQCTVHFFGNT